MKESPIIVELVDTMGTDLDVVNAARVSFHKESTFDPESLQIWLDEEVRSALDRIYAVTGERLSMPLRGKLREEDLRLLNFLARNQHWTPFAHCFLKFRIKAPIFVARQLVKHQVGLVWNEVSRRYVDDEPEFYFPDTWHKRPDKSIKQGAGEAHRLSADFSIMTENHCESALSLYNYYLAEGMAPEEARIVLPLNTMTEWIWSGSLFAFARVCRQRLDSHAQGATREVATVIDTFAAERFPASWQTLLAGVKGETQ